MRLPGEAAERGLERGGAHGPEPLGLPAPLLALQRGQAPGRGLLDGAVARGLRDFGEQFGLRDLGQRGRGDLFVGVLAGGVGEVLLGLDLLHAEQADFGERGFAQQRAEGRIVADPREPAVDQLGVRALLEELEGARGDLLAQEHLELGIGLRRLHGEERVQVVDLLEGRLADPGLGVLAGDVAEQGLLFRFHVADGAEALVGVVFLPLRAEKVEQAHRISPGKGRFRVALSENGALK